MATRRVIHHVSKGRTFVRGIMPRPEQVGANWLPTCADSPSQSCPKETRPKENCHVTLSLNFQTGLRAPLSSAYHSTTPQGGLEYG
jgi:hypothetical protein